MTDRYAVLGNPVKHSKSPYIHGAFAELTGQDLTYTAIEAPVDGFADAVDRFRTQGGQGINITAPFKVEAFHLATEARTAARLAGAANALKFEEEQVVAENFDGSGLVYDIEINLQVPIRGRRILLLGAGGAARGAMLPLLEKRPSQLMVVNRTAARLESFAHQFKPYGEFLTGGYSDLAGQTFDIVINATSASLQHESLPIFDNQFANGALAYDMAYGQGLTEFLAQARRSGVRHLADGVGMLVEQAAEAFLWWRGIRPPTARVIDALRVPLT